VKTQNMDAGKEIIQFTKDAFQNIGRWDNIIDDALSPMKDYTDTFGDIATPVKSLFSIIALKRKLTLKAFIKNYAKCLNADKINNIAETEKLISFIRPC
jgi:hypothetical protein